MLLEQIEWKDEPSEKLKKFKHYFDEELQDFKAMHKKAERNYRYWQGDQIDESKLSVYENPVIENRIFESIESLVPIAKNRTPEPAIYISPKDNQGEEEGTAYNLELQLKDALMNMWRDEWQMPSKITRIVRDDYIKYWGIIKFVYDADTDRFNFEVRDPSKIYCRKSANSLHDSDILIEENELELYKLIEMYPDDKEALIEEYGENKSGVKVKFFECWVNDFTINASPNWQTPFGQRKNPHFNREETNNDEVVRESEGHEGEIIPATKKKGVFTHNFFKESRKPYEEFASFRATGQVFNSTSLVEQAISLQDHLNRILIQIDVASQDNGLDIFNTHYIDEKVAKEVADKGPKGKLLADASDVGNLNAVALRLPPNRHLGDLQKQADAIRSAIDNMFGTHATTRGERKDAETATGRKILVGGDMSRGLPSTETLADFSQRIYDWAIQGIMVYWTSDRNVPVASNDDFTISQRDLLYTDEKDGEEKPLDITITVGQESVIPVDKAEEAKTAADLSAQGKLDLKTMYEKLGYSDPDQIAYRTILMFNNPAQYIQEILNIEGVQLQPLEGQPAEDEIETAMAAILQGQEPPLPQAPNRQGLEFLNKFPLTPEYDQLSTAIKEVLAKYIKEYTRLLSG